MYGLAFQQYALTAIAVAGGVGAAVVLGRPDKGGDQAQEAPAFTQKAEATSASSTLSDRALRRQQKFIKKADKEARKAERKAQKVGKRKAAGAVPSDEDFLADGQELEGQEPERLPEGESQAASVFGGARVNADLIPNIDGSLDEDPEGFRQVP